MRLSGAACCLCRRHFVAATSPRMTDRLVRVPRLADRSLVPAGVPEEAALVDRSDLNTIRLRWGSVKGKTQDVVVDIEEQPQHVVTRASRVAHARSTWGVGFVHGSRWFIHVGLSRCPR